MSTPINDGGPIHPCHPAQSFKFHTGMSLRDWFAGQALVGMLSNVGVDAPNDATLSKFAYSIADAMLAAREAKL